MKTAFCGPCFGAGDTPANGSFSIRHSTRNFPNREGSKLTEGQIASVALMDARSIAATAANKGRLTAATEMDFTLTNPVYHFDSRIYANRVFDSKGVAYIRDWPAMSALPENLVLKVVSEIHEPVTTTDELIPSGETSSYRSNPLRLAEFALSRKDPAYVGRAKEVQKAQKAIEAGEDPAAALPELGLVLETIEKQFGAPGEAGHLSGQLGVGSTIFAVKPGDGSAREQAASCQKVLGGWANIACSYATKRYRSNLINWGMLPLLTDEPEESAAGTACAAGPGDERGESSRDGAGCEGKLPFRNGDYLYLPGIRKRLIDKESEVEAYVVRDGQLMPFTMRLGSLTDDERQIILDGCLINFNKVAK